MSTRSCLQTFHTCCCLPALYKHRNHSSYPTFTLPKSQAYLNFKLAVLSVNMSDPSHITMIGVL